MATGEHNLKGPMIAMKGAEFDEDFTGQAEPPATLVQRCEESPNKWP